METQTDDSPMFTVEQKMFGGQVRLVPTFAPGDLEGESQARYGQLRNEIRSDGTAVIPPYPVGVDLSSGDRISLREVLQRLADRPSPSLTFTDKLIVVGIVAFAVVATRVFLAADSLLGHR